MFVPTLINDSKALIESEMLISSIKNGVNVNEQINKFWYNILDLENDEIQLIKNYKSSFLNTSLIIDDNSNFTEMIL